MYHYQIIQELISGILVYVVEIGHDVTIAKGLSESDEKLAVKAAADAFLVAHPTKSTD